MDTCARGVPISCHLPHSQVAAALRAPRRPLRTRSYPPGHAARLALGAWALFWGPPLLRTCTRNGAPRWAARGSLSGRGPRPRHLCGACPPPVAAVHSVPHTLVQQHHGEGAGRALARPAPELARGGPWPAPRRSPARSTCRAASAARSSGAISLAAGSTLCTHALVALAFSLCFFNCTAVNHCRAGASASLCLSPLAPASSRCASLPLFSRCWSPAPPLPPPMAYASLHCQCCALRATGASPPRLPAALRRCPAAPLRPRLLRPPSGGGTATSVKADCDLHLPPALVLAPPA